MLRSAAREERQPIARAERSGRIGAPSGERGADSRKGNTLLKGLKQALGVGKAEDYYAAALEQLAQQQHAGALTSFASAAKKAKADGQSDLAARAEASIHLYQFIADGRSESLSAMARHLPGAGWIERPGEPSVRVSAPALVAEVEGRLALADLSAKSPQERHDAHRRAAEAFARCGEHRLVTYPHHHERDKHVELAHSRHLYHTGMMHAIAADQLFDTDPDGAARAMGRAVAAFAACDDTDRQEACGQALRRIQTRRTCWLCHREFPGEGRLYSRTPARVTPYIADYVAAQGQDASCVDPAQGEVVLCVVCRTLIDGRAEPLMQKLEASIMKAVDSRITEMIQNLPRR